jgi:hypothetical protein
LHASRLAPAHAPLLPAHSTVIGQAVAENPICPCTAAHHTLMYPQAALGFA